MWVGCLWRCWQCCTVIFRSTTTDDATCGCQRSSIRAPHFDAPPATRVCTASSISTSLPPDTRHSWTLSQRGVVEAVSWRVQECRDAALAPYDLSYPSAPARFHVFIIRIAHALYVVILQLCLWNLVSLFCFFFFLHIDMLCPGCIFLYLMTIHFCKQSNIINKGKHSLAITKVIFTLSLLYHCQNGKESRHMSRQEALQMQRDRATRHKYEISHLKRLAIGECYSRTLKVSCCYWIVRIRASLPVIDLLLKHLYLAPFLKY